MIRLAQTLILLVLLSATPANAQDYFFSEQQSMEEYKKELEYWQQQKQESESELESLTDEIFQLNTEIVELRENIAKVRQQTLNMLSSYVDNSLNTNKEKAVRLKETGEKEKREKS